MSKKPKPKPKPTWAGHYYQRANGFFWALLPSDCPKWVVKDFDYVMDMTAHHGGPFGTEQEARDDCRRFVREAAEREVAEFFEATAHTGRLDA